MPPIHSASPASTSNVGVLDVSNSTGSSKGKSFLSSAGQPLLENSTIEVFMKECLVICEEEDASVQFLHRYGVNDNVKALKGKFIARMKSQSPNLRMEDLEVTFAGKRLAATENISKLRIPVQVGDRIKTYNASNEPFIVVKRCK